MSNNFLTDPKKNLLNYPIDLCDTFQSCVTSATQVPKKVGAVKVGKNSPSICQTIVPKTPSSNTRRRDLFILMGRQTRDER
jgi:hypothetical protein